MTIFQFHVSAYKWIKSDCFSLRMTTLSIVSPYDKYTKDRANSKIDYQMKYKRILLKLSGEALMGDKQFLFLK